VAAGCYAVEPKIGIKPEAQQPSLHRPLWNDAKSAEDWLQKSATFDSLVSHQRSSGKDHSKILVGTFIFINLIKRSFIFNLLQLE
jgi:hypothetical protein